MKSTFDKKLVLRKSTITQLSNDAMGKILGGNEDQEVDDNAGSSWWDDIYKSASKYKDKDTKCTN